MSEHWYSRKGDPAYYSLTKDGRETPTTLRHARQYGYVPSVTTVLGILDKPALTTWKCKEAIKAALWNRDRMDYETEDSFVELCLTESGKIAKDAADIGSQIHDAIEKSFKGEPFDHQWRQHVNAVDRELSKLFPHVDDWVSEKSFGHPIGFGGKVDLHSPSTGIVVDYKTKSGALDDGKRLAYDQVNQLSAYRLGLELPRENVCANIFVSRDVPGAVASHVWTREQVDEGEDIFLISLALWKAIKKYESGWSDEANRSQQ